MEELLKQQRTEVDELTRLICNYKKDGPERKTERYLADKINTFDECIRIIRKNDEEIQNLRKPVDETISLKKLSIKLQRNMMRRYVKYEVF